MSIQTTIGMFGNPSSEFFFSENEMHQLLASNFEEDSEFWLLKTSSLKSFSKKIEKLFVVSNGGFTFQATWRGEATTSIKSLPISGFLELVQNNKIGRNTKYVVVGTV